jgi:hypothetical protein
MALIVEDGTALINSESYISVVDARTYVSDFYGTSHAFYVLTDAEIERYLRRAAQYMEGKYEHRWRGYRKTYEQALAWPRTAVDDPLRSPLLEELSYPQKILGKAQTEIAIRIAAGTDVNPDLDRGGMVKREKADVLEIEYFEGAPGQFAMPQVDETLSRYLKGSKHSLEIVRG